jgi:hypothetical protein
MEAKARVEVDFHLAPDGSHTLASLSDVHPPVQLSPGDVVVATDGEDARYAVVDTIDGDTVSLVVLWDHRAPAA